jgi:4-amino-4-deoxy-L-arabinose transferase-like glycosyltransferase
MAVAVRAPHSIPLLPVRGRGGWAFGGCLLLVLALRAPYLSTALGRDEGGVAFIARSWPSSHGSLYGAYWLDRPPGLVGLFKLAVLGGDIGVRVLGALAALALVAAVARLGREVAGQRAGLLAGLLAALLTGSVAIGAVYTPGELLAAVPSTLSILCLVLAHRRRQARLLFAAGLLAAGAVLIKQSFLDAGLAGLAFVVASGAVDRSVRVRWPLVYVTGVAVPIAALLAWQVLAQLPDGGFVYALVGFRIDALHVLAGSARPLHVRLEQLALPAIASGLALVVGLAVVGLGRLRGDRVLLVTLAAWLSGAAVGVLGGGSYWPHYLIELVPVSCVAAAAGLAGRRKATRVAIVGACASVALIASAGGLVRLALHPQHQAELAVARYVRVHSRPGDTQYVMYARANVGYYTGLPSPYPYAWSLMVQTVPGARARLQRLLGSARRPTWVVQWQDADRWQLDPGARTDRLLAHDYRLAATVRGHRIYLRSDRRPETPASAR